MAAKTDRENEFPMAMWKSFGKAGWVHQQFVLPDCKMLISSRFLGITADEEFGGLAMGYQAHAIVLEELSRASG